MMSINRLVLLVTEGCTCMEVLEVAWGRTSIEKSDDGDLRKWGVVITGCSAPSGSSFGLVIIN
jgi:hypothetical protein